jgi:hypothetical protein
MANKVIAAGFDIQRGALAAAIQRLESNRVVKVKRGVIVSKDQHGNLSIPGIREVGDSWGLLGGFVEEYAND